MDNRRIIEILLGLHEEFMLTTEQQEAINAAMDQLETGDSANKLEAGLDRADAAMQQALRAGEVQTALLRTLVEQTRYQYMPGTFSGARYRVDTRTGNYEPTN